MSVAQGEVASVSAAGRAVVIDDVVKSHGGFELGPLSAALPRGVTALLGPNGAGKSTLMRLVVGITAVDRGSIRDESDRAPRGAGYLPQDFQGPRGVTARDYLRFVAWCRSTRSRRIGVREVDDALETVGLSSRARSRIGALSGGMVRRLGVAQALLGETDLLVLDEPTVGLDPVQRDELRSLVRLLGERAVVLLSTHHSDDVAAVADRVLVLNDGAKLFEGTVDELTRGAGYAARSSEAVEAGFLGLIRGGTDA